LKKILYFNVLIFQLAENKSSAAVQLMHENMEIKQEKLKISKEKLFLQREKLEYLKNIHSNFKNIFNNIDYNIKCLKEEMEKNSTFISHIIIKN